MNDKLELNYLLKQCVHIYHILTPSLIVDLVKQQICNIFDFKNVNNKFDMISKQLN